MEQLDVRKLSQEWKAFHWNEAAKSLGLEAEPPYQYPIAIDLNASRFGDRVSVRGTVRCRVRLECSRCLEAFEDSLEADVAIEFTEGPQPRRRVDEIADEEADLSYYTAPFVDLTDDLRQILLIAAPAYPVCREECLGLCPTCGTNLNNGRCTCPAEGRRRPFEDLGSLLKKEL